MPAETAHFVLSDCVQSRLAVHLARADVPIACATSIREVNCKDCRRQIDEIANTWLSRFQTRLTPLQDQVRRNADTIKYQLQLIERLNAIIAGKANYDNVIPLHSRNGDRCPTCARGALLVRTFRGNRMLCCDQFDSRGCDYAVPLTRRTPK